MNQSHNNQKSNSMKKTLILAFGLLILISCHKEEPIIMPNNNIYINIENNQVFLDSNHRIVKVFTTTEANKFVSETNYYYSDSLIVRIFNDSASNHYFTKYKMTQNGYAENSIDTFFIPSNLNMRTDSTIYSYDVDGYLSTSEIFSSVGHSTTNFNYVNGDLMNVETCTITYCDTLNKIELYWFYFSNGIAGKISKHLIKKISEQLAGIPPQVSNFQYLLDSEGYVIERTKTIQQNSDIYHYITRYNYIFNYTP